VGAGAGCDAGGQTNQSQGGGAPVHFVANVGPDQPLPENGAIQLTFDRLLMPAVITRQTFVLSTLTGAGLMPNVAYDPVSRVVTVTPLQGELTAGQTYQITVLPAQPGVTYTQPEDTVIGLMAIDGATLDPALPATITFQATAGVTQIGVPMVDYCTQINKMFAGSCGGLSCHNPPPDSMPAQGLVLTEPAGVTSTAVGQVAVGANTGPRPAAQSANVIFGLDMPIIDPGTGTGGNPGNSWLMYKVLMAVPPPMAPDAGVPGPGGADIIPLSSTERATLASLVSGREMPFPGIPSASIDAPGAQLTLAELETLSQWIAQPQGLQIGSCP
jgi:hypothetical protein